MLGARAHSLFYEVIKMPSPGPAVSDMEKDSFIILRASEHAAHLKGRATHYDSQCERLVAIFVPKHLHLRAQSRATPFVLFPQTTALCWCSIPFEFLVCTQFREWCPLARGAWRASELRGTGKCGVAEFCVSPRGWISTGIRTERRDAAFYLRLGSVSNLMALTRLFEASEVLLRPGRRQRNSSLRGIPRDCF